MLRVGLGGISGTNILSIGRGVSVGGGGVQPQPWWLAGGTIDKSAVVERVENPTSGQFYGGGTLSDAWTIALVTSYAGGNVFAFDSNVGRLTLGEGAQGQNGFLAGSAGWQDIDLFPVDTQNRVYFLVSNGSSIQAYRDDTAIGVPVSSTVDIGGTTRWGRNQSGGANIWGRPILLGAVYNIALDATQRNALYQAMWSVSVTSPATYQVIQRDNNDEAAIVVSGTYVGTPSAIEARFNGGSWATIDASPSGGTYSGTLSAQAAGQGTLEVRFVDAPGVTASVDNVGIGDVFVIGGQSNASGRGNNNQSYSHATLKAALFGNDYAWQELTDPTDSNSGQVDTVSDDSAAGSCWPLLATQIMAATGYPVAFVPAPKGGTSIAQWQPGVDHQDRSTLYGSMVYRANQVGTVKAVLWWQGERDAVLGTAEATYNSGLDTVANAVNADLSCSLVVCKIEDLSTYNTGYDETAVNNAIATAWSDNANVVAGPDFSDITPSVDGVHFKTDQELQAAADRWFAALQAAVLV